jgi:hypothetical protein
MDVMLIQWKNKIPAIGIQTDKDSCIKIILFADDQVLTATSEMDLQAGIRRVYLIMSEYNLKISIQKTKIMECHWKEPGRYKIILDDGTVEQVCHFNFLGRDTTYCYENM